MKHGIGEYYLYQWMPTGWVINQSMGEQDDANDKTVADLPRYTGPGEPPEGVKLVRMLNSHQGLVDACKRLSPSACQAESYASPNFNSGHPCGKCAYCVGRAALKSAGAL